MADNVSFIPVANPRLKALKYKREILRAFESVIESGNYILSKEVNMFEKEFADFVGVKYSIGLANGTDAIALALKSVGVRPGDEVITVSHSAVATVAAIEAISAVPVLVDIDPTTRCMNPELLPELISSKTKVILPVHIYGQPASMKDIINIANKYGIKVVEDCAQAHGAEIEGKKVGSFGNAAAFSFYPTKNLGGIGDGGAAVTNSSETAQFLNEVRQYGWHERYISSFAGNNSRLDELQASILRIFLKNLNEDNQRRIEIARLYDSVIDGEIIKAPPNLSGTKSVYHLYVVETEYRDELSKHLNNSGIGTGLHYPLPIHLQPAYRRIKGANRLQKTEKLYKRILSLPMYPELTNSEVEKVQSSLKEWINSKT